MISSDPLRGFNNIKYFMYSLLVLITRLSPSHINASKSPVLSICFTVFYYCSLPLLFHLQVRFGLPSFFLQLGIFHSQSLGQCFSEISRNLFKCCYELSLRYCIYNNKNKTVTSIVNNQSKKVCVFM